MKNNIIIILLVIGGVAVTWQQCKTPEISSDNFHRFDSIVEITRDTILYDTIYIPTPYQTIKDSFIYRYKNVDTAAILADYYSTEIYLDTIIDDTTAFLCITDSVTQNRIISRSYRFSQYPIFKTIIIQKTISPKWNLYAGFLGSGSSTRLGISPSVLFSRNKKTYSLGYDIINKEINIGMYWQIF